MADKEIGDLTAASTLTGAELVHVVQGGNSRKATVAALAGQASVVLADIDLSTTDIRLAGTPLEITGIDEFSRLDVLYDATTASGATYCFMRLSNDGGASFRSGGSDYGVSQPHFAIHDANRDYLTVVGGSSTSGFGMAFILGMGNANIQTQGYGETAGNSGSETYMGRCRTREVNDAIQIFTQNATTAGRLQVIGYR